LSRPSTGSLSQNQISDLSPLAACARLREVYLRRNLVRDLAALAPLASLPELRIVWLEENEVAADARYRPFLIRLCRRLEKIDTTAVGEGERKAAHAGDDAALEEMVRRALPAPPPRRPAAVAPAAPAPAAAAHSAATAAAPPGGAFSSPVAASAAASGRHEAVTQRGAAKGRSNVLSATLLLVRELAAAPDAEASLAALAAELAAARAGRLA